MRGRMPDFMGFRTKRRDLLIFNATLSLLPPDKPALSEFGPRAELAKSPYSDDPASRAESSVLLRGASAGCYLEVCSVQA